MIEIELPDRLGSIEVEDRGLIEFVGFRRLSRSRPARGDGRWVAYQPDESGESQVYIRGFPVATEQIPVSPRLGLDPVWSPNGGTIYYRVGTRFFAVDWFEELKERMAGG